MPRSSPGQRKRGKLKPSGRKPSPRNPAPRNPYAVATKRLGHRIKPSIKAYTRKGRNAPEADGVE